MFDSRSEMSQEIIALATPQLFVPSFAGSASVCDINGTNGKKTFAEALWTLSMAAFAGGLVLSTNPLPSVDRNLSFHSTSSKYTEASGSNAIPAETTQSLVAHLKGKGMPIAAIAEVVCVERKTVYSWLDSGVDAKQSNFDRLATLERIFAREATGSLRFYHRFWERKTSGGQTLKAILTAENLNEGAAQAVLEYLRPGVGRAMNSETRRKSRPTIQSPAAHLTIDIDAGSWL